MIIFIYGPDTFRSKNKLKEIVDHYKELRGGINLDYFDFEKNNLEEFKSSLQTVSMFKEKRLVVIKNLFLNKESKAKISKIIKNLKDSEDIFIIYEEGEMNEKNALFVDIKKNSDSQEFSLLKGETLIKWLRKEFAVYNKEVSIDVLNELVNFIGNDMWQLNNEIKKLSSFCRDKKITKEDVKLLVNQKIETAIFKTIDAIALRNTKMASLLIHRHLEEGENPLYLLSMIISQFRNLLMVKDLIEKNCPYSVIAQKTKMHPFVLKKSYEQSRGFTLQELKKIYTKLLEIDLYIKTGKMNSETAIDLLITEL